MLSGWGGVMTVINSPGGRGRDTSNDIQSGLCTPYLCLLNQDSFKSIKCFDILTISKAVCRVPGVAAEFQSHYLLLTVRYQLRLHATILSSIGI